MPSARRPHAARPAPSARGRRIALNVILGAAAVDGALLIVLLYVALVNRSDGAVQVLGPLFGFGYVYLLYLTATGSMRGRWGWWFTGLVAVTAGPVGAIIGARRLLREDEPTPGPAPTASLTRKQRRRAAAEQRRAGGR